MFALLIKLILLASASGDVTQEPNTLWVPQGGSANMYCSHTKDATYFYMSWFQQQQGEPMKLIAFTMPNQKPDFGDFKEQYKEKFSANKTDVQSGSFTVKNVQPDDSGANDVAQNPSILWAWQKESAEMNCSHSKGAGYFYMYWFRQQQGKSMELIAFTTLNQDPDFGTFSKEKYSATKTVAQDGSFTVKNVQPDDSGVYFCAVSEHSLHVSQNPKEILILPDSPLKVICTITGTDNPNLYWYRWTPTDGVKLVFSSLGVGIMDPETMGDFTSNRPRLLQIELESKHVTQIGSAVWYCAASPHSMADKSGCCTKTHGLPGTKK